MNDYMVKVVCHKMVSTIVLLFFSLCTYSQGISVTKFYLAENDLTALNEKNIVLDQNGEKCALIRMQTTEKGFVFDVGSIGIQQIEDNHIGEIWLYVPYGVKHLDIRHRLYGSLVGYTFPISINKGRTYILELRTIGIPQNKKNTNISVKDNVSRKVLFTMKENEHIYNTEYVANLNMQDNSFTCIVIDTITNKKTFVWNGERKVTADNLKVYHVDLFDYNKCVLGYSHEGSEVINVLFLDGKTFGPYDGEVKLLTENYSWAAEYKDPGMLGIDKSYRRGWILKDYFVFSHFGKNYLYDHGKVSYAPFYAMLSSDGTSERHDLFTLQDDILKGRRRNQNIKMEYKGQNLIINDKIYKHYSVQDVKEDEERFERWGQLITNGTDLVYAWLPSEEVLVNLSTGTLRSLKENEAFDYEHFKIVPKPQNWDRFFERKSPWDSILLQDKNSSNTLMSSLEEDYVQVNNSKIGKGPALSAIYDSQQNAFIWTTLENKELVMYQVNL